MKKIIAISLLAVSLVTLSACSPGSKSDGEKSNSTAETLSKEMKTWVDKTNAGMKEAKQQVGASMSKITAKAKNNHTLLLTYTYKEPMDQNSVKANLPKMKTDFQSGMQTELQAAKALGVKAPKIQAIYKNPDGQVLATLTATLNENK